MLTPWQKGIKRSFDVLVSLMLVGVLIIPIACLFVIASLDTKQFGLFKQERIGRFGKSFDIFKIRTLSGNKSYSLKEAEIHISMVGSWLKKYKLNELPQFFNVLKGDMSLVGPRPDLPGYADQLEGEDRMILTVRPGITGPATLKYKDEETILAAVEDPEAYNNGVIWPDKVAINKRYVREWSFFKDLGYLWKTVF